VVSHLAVYGLTPVLSMHMVALGGTSAQVGLLFSVFSLVSVILRPLAGVWIDRSGVHQALVPGAVLVVLTSVALQVARGPLAFIALMAGFGVGYGLVTMAAAVLAASAPAAERGRALSLYYLAAPVSMAVAAPLGLWLFREVGVRANFGLVTVLGLAATVFALARHPAGEGRAASTRDRARLWSRGAVPLSLVLVLAAMGQSVLYAFLPLHAAVHKQDQHLTWFFGLYSIAMVVFRIGVSTMADQWGRAPLLVPALGLLAAGFGVLIAPPSPLGLAVAAVLLGAGSSALYPMLVALVVDRVPDRERGVAMGMVSGAWDLGVFAGSLLIGAVVERASLGVGFGMASVLMVMALASFVTVERRRIRIG
jgi:predicted MFS family arabinose efflux permease